MERNENGFSVKWEQREQQRDFACPGTGEPWQNGSLGDAGSGNLGCAAECSDKQLAMVYSPKQCWRMIFSPADAMRHGTMFEELYKPLEGYGNE